MANSPGGSMTAATPISPTGNISSRGLTSSSTTSRAKVTKVPAEQPAARCDALGIVRQLHSQQPCMGTRTQVAGPQSSDPRLIPHVRNIGLAALLHSRLRDSELVSPGNGPHDYSRDVERFSE